MEENVDILIEKIDDMRDYLVTKAIAIMRTLL